MRRQKSREQLRVPRVQNLPESFKCTCSFSPRGDLTRLSMNGFFLIYHFYSFHVHVCAHMCHGSLVETIRGQIPSQFSPSTLWVLDIRLRLNHTVVCDHQVDFDKYSSILTVGLCGQFIPSFIFVLIIVMLYNGGAHVPWPVWSEDNSVESVHYI